MRISKLFTKTLKNAPSDEVSKNAQLLIRAGYVYKEMAGAYAYLPLGLRVVENIKRIVREEMNAIDSQELIMTSLQRREVWEKTGRWSDETVDVWFKTHLKDDTEVGFGWSHEEPIVEMLKQYIHSHKDLPISLYQFQTKMRNELRAKSGIMRGREFIMKDMYSFHANAEDLDAYYNESIEAYKRVFDRLGIGEETYVTFASGGAFTKFSHEFQTICSAGEDVIYRVPSTKQSFNEEVAPVLASDFNNSNEKELPLKEVEGVGLIGVEPLAKFLEIPVEKTTKTMLYQTETGQVIAAAIRGNSKINEEKLKNIVGAQRVALADEATVKRVTGAEVGYAGLLNLPKDVRIVVDRSCAGRKNFEMGANRTNYHSMNVNWGRDLPEPEEYYDIKLASRGDRYPETGEEYDVLKTAEVGNIFNFGTQKTDEMGLKFTGSDGKEKSLFLGSYGIGVTRVMGVIVEKMSDDKGIVWPENVAPYQVYLVSIGDKGSKKADELYEQLKKAGIEVLYDDRDERAGTKFTDADLLGIPQRVTVSDRLVEAGQVELKARTSDATKTLTAEQLIDTLKSV